MKDNPYIKKLVNNIAEHCNELKKVYLISIIIVDNSVENNSELECRLYLNIDCELPFDLVIYREDEFNKLKCEIGTFAWKINNSGTVLYG